MEQDGHPGSIPMDASIRHGFPPLSSPRLHSDDNIASFAWMFRTNFPEILILPFSPLTIFPLSFHSSPFIRPLFFSVPPFVPTVRGSGNVISTDAIGSFIVTEETQVQLFGLPGGQLSPSRPVASPRSIPTVFTMLLMDGWMAVNALGVGGDRFDAGR